MPGDIVSDISIPVDHLCPIPVGVVEIDPVMNAGDNCAALVVKAVPVMVIGVKIVRVQGILMGFICIGIGAVRTVWLGLVAEKGAGKRVCVVCSVGIEKG